MMQIIVQDDDWGHFVDIDQEEDNDNVEDPFQKLLLYNKGLREKELAKRNRRTMIMKEEKEPVPVPLKDNDTVFITIKPDRPRPLTIEDFAKPTGNQTTRDTSFSFINSVLLTAMIFICLVI